MTMARCAGSHLRDGAGERADLRRHVGIQGVDEGIRLVSFMSHALGYFDLEQKTLQPFDNSFGPRVSAMS